MLFEGGKEHYYTKYKNRKYWLSLNLVVWPQTDCTNILMKFKFGGGAIQCRSVYRGVLLSRNWAEFPASTKNNNTHCTGCIKQAVLLMLLSKQLTSVLFLVQFNNFVQTMGFYWSYTLFLKSPILMHSCGMSDQNCDKEERSQGMRLIYSVSNQLTTIYYEWLSEVLTTTYHRCRSVRSPVMVSTGSQPQGNL